MIYIVEVKPTANTAPVSFEIVLADSLHPPSNELVDTMMRGRGYFGKVLSLRLLPPAPTPR